MPLFNIFCEPPGAGNFGKSIRADATMPGFTTGGIPAGNCSAILGGILNNSGGTHLICGDLSVILMGATNQINSFTQPGPVTVSSCFNSIFNGTGHHTAGCFSAVNNGNENNTYGCFTDIYNGNGNVITCSYITSCDACYSAIGNGESNTVCGVFLNIFNGRQNLIAGNEGSSIINGECNEIYGGKSVIGTGVCNRIGSPSFCGTSFNGILSGTCNIIDFGGENAFIGAGAQNQVFGSKSSITAGVSNKVASTYSFVGNGEANTINCGSECSFLGGGYSNNMGSGIVGDLGAIGSFMGGGESNCIDSDDNFGTTYAAIGGGQFNKVCLNTNHSSIFSGMQNTVRGNCSSILGGEGNDDGGIDYVGIFGCGVTGVVTKAFHANNYVAQNMPSSNPSITGVLYYCVCGIGNCPVFIS
jgi:hypothetical protein